MAIDVYTANLQSQRDHAARLCETHAVALLDARPAERREIADGLNFYSNMRDKLDQQLSWMNRRSGISSPAQPAWSN